MAWLPQGLAVQAGAASSSVVEHAIASHLPARVPVMAEV